MTYSGESNLAWGRLIEYGDRLDKTVFKRLGYIAETLGLADKELVRRMPGAGQCRDWTARSNPTRWWPDHGPLGFAGQRADRRMIARAALQTRAQEWGLTEEVVEKDDVLGRSDGGLAHIRDYATTGSSRVAHA